MPHPSTRAPIGATFSSSAITIAAGPTAATAIRIPRLPTSNARRS